MKINSLNYVVSSNKQFLPFVIKLTSSHWLLAPRLVEKTQEIADGLTQDHKKLKQE